MPSVLEATVAPLRDAGMGVIVYPGVGFVYASSEDGTTLEAVDAAAGAADADLLLEALPEPLRRDRDVFGDPGPRAPLLRALKQRFDPSGILNPGRAQGHL